jgi:hypothetical protein
LDDSVTVHFREKKRIIEVVEKTADVRGSNRSAIFHEAIRFWLAANGLLPREDLRYLPLSKLLQEARQYLEVK